MHADELRDHLAETTEYVERARWHHLENQTLTIADPDEMRTFGGFGPKAPNNATALELADLEVAFIGNLHDYCVAMGTIPPIPNRAFWRRNNGEVLGLKPGEIREDQHGEHYPELQKVIQHLRAYAGEIAQTFGADDILRAGIQTRLVSKWHFDKEGTDYRGTAETAKIIGVTDRTLQLWAENDWVDHTWDHKGDLLINVNAAKQVKELIGVKRKYDAKKRYQESLNAIPA